MRLAGGRPPLRRDSLGGLLDMRTWFLLASLAALASCSSERKPSAASRVPAATAAVPDSARLARCRNATLQAPARSSTRSEPDSDSARAVASLSQFLAEACSGSYDSAMALYTGDWHRLARNWGFTPADTVSPGAFLRAACAGLLALCDLTPRRLARLSRRGDTLRVTLELNETNGHRFEPPPCCGSDGPPDTLFDFYVVRTPAGFRSISLPVYRP